MTRARPRQAPSQAQPQAPLRSARLAAQADRKARAAIHANLEELQRMLTANPEAAARVDQLLTPEIERLRQKLVQDKAHEAAAVGGQRSE